MSLIKEATSRHRKELFRSLVSHGKVPERYGYGPKGPLNPNIEMFYEMVGGARREGKSLDAIARRNDPAYQRALKLRRKIELNRQRLNSAAASTPSAKPSLTRGNLALVANNPARQQALKLTSRIEPNRRGLNLVAASTPSGKPFLSRRNLAIGSAAAGLTALGTAAYLRNRKRKQEERQAAAYS